MKIVKSILVSLLLTSGLSTYADVYGYEGEPLIEEIDQSLDGLDVIQLEDNEVENTKVVTVDGALAKQIFSKLAKHSDKQCDDEQCLVKVNPISCMGIIGFYNCDFGHYEDGKYIYTMLFGSEAKTLYKSLQNIKKAFCDNEYSQLCINNIKGAMCSCSGGFFNKKYFCQVRI